jgi:hypothetical protein
MKCDKKRYNIGKKNPMFGKKHSPNTIMKMKLIKQKENNPNWQDIPTYYAVHLWINRNYIKPKMCETCKVEKSYDLANITGIYERDLKNWKWLCRKCHMRLDEHLHKRKNGRFIRD